MKDQAMKCATLLAIVCAQWLPCYGEQKAGETFRSPAGSETNKGNAGRSAYFGDLHLHTSYSFDAYFTPGVTVDPDMAYRFAKGEVVNYLGQPVQRREPLDFIAITDHAENIGVFNQLEVPDSDFAKSDLGKAFKNLRSLITSDPRWRQNPAFLEQLYSFGRDYFSGSTNKLPQDLVPERTAAWDREIAFANRHYQPGKFTTFIAYEWSSTPFGANLHRNVIFRGDKAPFPFSSFDSKVPEDLWKWLDTIRAQGYEAIAIPHNSNASNGLMYDWVDSYSLPIGREYAQDRQRNEPLSEIAQSKGASETHPLLSPNDEFADYELYDFIAGPRRMAGRAEGSYLRDAVGKGVVLQRQLGVNPYKYGFVGGSDFHSGLSVSAQSDYAGRGDTINMGAGRPTKDQVANALDPSRGSTGIGLRTTSGNLTGVWADSNTRESIYDALRRRETFATSGTRLKFRIFGGWDFGDSKLPFQNDWVRSAYARGVPMGSDLPERPIGASAPQFTIWALKDPNGGNLDRVQVIKVWEEDGRQKEAVFDVAWSGPRRLDPKTGKLPPVGNSVDLKTGTYKNNIGAAELKVLWSDPQFNPEHFAAYYLRVLEIPTPRWSTLLATQNELPLPTGTPTTVQQRGWSSPIWYTPQGEGGKHE